MPLLRGHILFGSAFGEPVRVLSAEPAGPGRWSVALVGTRTSQFREAILTDDDLSRLKVLEATALFDGDPELLRLGVQAYALGIAYEFDPYFGLSMSRVDPLPHQLEAVYDYLLKAARVRFLLADDAGAGKTIMAGLLIRELKLRGLADRILVIGPANLAFQWQRELKEKFDLKFTLLRGADIRDQFGVNQWMEQRHVVTSLDLAKRTEILPGLRQARWDLVIVDEAHRMSASDETHKSQRYKLGEILRDTADHILLLTATPHKGDPENFSLFLRLLDPDVYADVRSIREAMERRQAPFYLRRTKEAMVHFPERGEDGSWQVRKIFTKRIPKTVDFRLDGEEFDLYSEVTRFVKRQSARAAARGEDPRARALGFLMALYQRRLASSTHALRRSLEKRAERLSENLDYAQRLVQSGQIPSLPDAEELEEMEEAERARFEELIEAVSLSQSADEIRREIEDLEALSRRAREVESAEVEAKLGRLRRVLEEEGFFDDRTKLLLLFTEFKDTLDYLVQRLEDWGFKVGSIHGGMKPGSRNEPGTRLFMEQQFREAAIQVLVATEAAGEGINLQACHILFNYDIPWNPNRLEQRMGRIHRYGQRRDCLIFNFVAVNTIEGRVLQKLLDRLKEIRDALDDDQVFNVVGEVLPANQVEKVLREYYAGQLGDQDLEDRLLHDVDEGRFRAICQNALEGLATKSLNLEMLVERRAQAQERRVVPETIARFLSAAAQRAGLSLSPLPRYPFAFEAGRTPLALRKFESDADWRLLPVADKYGRLTTDRDAAETHNLEWVTPGHPLFESLRRAVLLEARETFGKGARFWSLQHAAPARLDLFRARVVDGLDAVIEERLFAVEVTEYGSARLSDPAILGNLSPAAPDTGVPTAVIPEVPLPWLSENVLDAFVSEVKGGCLAEIRRVQEHVEFSLTELLHRADLEIGRAQGELDDGIQGAAGRLAQAETRHADLLARRERRRDELTRQGTMILQGVERLTSALILPHPERDAPHVRRLRPDPETEASAMRVAMEYERTQGRQVYDVHEKNLGYDLTSIDLATGELRLIEVKGIGAATGTVLLTPNERRVAEDRRDCYWLYVVTDCAADPRLQDPVRDPARLPWHEVVKVAHYSLSVDAMRSPMTIREGGADYGSREG